MASHQAKRDIESRNDRRYTQEPVRNCFLVPQTDCVSGATGNVLRLEAARSPTIAQPAGRIVRDDAMRCPRCGGAVKKRGNASDAPSHMIERQLADDNLKESSASPFQLARPPTSLRLAASRAMAVFSCAGVSPPKPIISPGTGGGV